MSVRHQVVSIGYRGKSPDAFFERLQSVGVTWLLDIRYSPETRYYAREYDKEQIQVRCSMLGIQYTHMLALGNINFYNLDLPCEIVDMKGGVDVILDLIEGQHKVALMCSCEREEVCHRRYVIEALKKRRRDIEIETIEPPSSEALFS